MRPNRLILAIVALTCCLLLQTGCEEDTMAPQQTLSSDFFRQFNQIQRTSRPAATTRRTTARTRRTAPKIEFEKIVHDFGNIGPGTNNFCEFKFTNTGNGTLQIGDIVPNCGCTPFELAKKEYAPGESGTLKVNYYSEKQHGRATKQLVLYSNDKSNPKITLAVEASIIMKVDHEPKSLKLLLNKENADCPQITITGIDGRPFSITSFKSTANCMTADFNPSVEATQFVLQPKVDMAKLEATLNGRIEIGLSHPECDTISLTLNALPKFRITPRSIIVRGMDSREPIVKKLRILNNYDEDFKLESIWSNNGAVKVLSNSVVRNGYELELEIRPPASQNTRRVFNEKFFVKLSEGRQLEIPCNVFYSKKIPQSLTTETEDGECKTCGPKKLDFAAGTVTGPSGVE